MEILFGSVPTEFLLDAENFTSEGLPGEYYYKVEMLDVDTVTISDTVGRSIPLDFSHLPQLIAALEFLDNKVGNLVDVATSAKAELMELNIAS